MTAMRRVLAGLLMALAVACSVAWLLATLLVHAITDEQTVVVVAERALDTETVSGLITDQAYQAVASNLEDRGIDVEQAGVDAVVKQALRATIESEAFSDVVAFSVRAGHRELTLLLTDPDRAPGPYAITIDAGDLIVKNLADVPFVGQAVDGLDLPSVNIQVLSAETVQTARDAYQLADRAHRLIGWLALLFFALALLAMPRRSRFIATVLYTFGGLSLVVWFFLDRVDVDRIVAAHEGKDDAVTVLAGLIQQDEIDDVASWLLRGGITAVIVATVTVLLMRRHDRKRRDEAAAASA